MVRLPFACGVGKDSLLHTLVDSDVPVQAFGTQTVRAVIRHKWRLYARSKLLLRSINYCFYTLCFTVYAILYSMVSEGGKAIKSACINLTPTTIMRACSAHHASACL